MPSFRYRNAPVAIEWLCRVFGLRKNLVVPDDSGGVAHAQLSFGDGMIMLGSVRENERGRFIKQPDGCRCYLRTSQNVGAEILIPIKDEEYWRAQFFLSRSRRSSLDHRHLRSLEERRRLAGGPAHLALPEHVDMQMRDAFPRVGPTVNHNPETVFEFELFCYFGRGQQQVT